MSARVGAPNRKHWKEFLQIKKNWDEFDLKCQTFSGAFIKAEANLNFFDKLSFENYKFLNL